MRNIERIFGSAFIFIEAAYILGLIGNAILWCTFFAPVPPPPVPPVPVPFFTGADSSLNLCKCAPNAGGAR